ncbi:MAG: PDZ domain-containing protein [bacterium]
MHRDLPISTPRPLPILVLVSTFAALAVLGGCETTSSGRPKSTKGAREQREAPAKSPAQWSVMGDAPEFPSEMDEEQMTVDMTVEVTVEQGAGPGGSDVIIERRTIRRVAGPGGPPMPGGRGSFARPNPDQGPDQGPGQGPGPGPGQGPGQGPGPGAGGADDPKPVHPPVMLGVRMRELDPVLATHLGLNPRKCSVLEDVAEELGGHAGGLRDHDIIIAVDGSDDASPSHVRRVLRSKKPGDTIEFQVLRAGTKSDVKITLEGFDHVKLLSVTPARIGG